MILFILERCRYRESARIKLPRRGMVIDPRPNNEDVYLRHCRFECIYHENGTMVTLTRIDDFKRHDPFVFRLYDPATEPVPDFNSTTYTYLGVHGERAPLDTSILIIHPLVRIIRKEAFWLCDRIKKCIMYDGVHTIEEKAFYFCSDMKVIRLSKSLKRIGKAAFFYCTSLDALFIPPTIEKIEDNAFIDSMRIRILPLPLGINIGSIGETILSDCHTFFETTQIQRYQYWRHTNMEGYNNDEVHRSILEFYHSLPPLHRACLDTNVSAQTIINVIRTNERAAVSTMDHDGMTPLHILAMNPHADAGAILACFHANVYAAFVGDSRHRTPLDYLKEYHEIEVHTSLIAALCMHPYTGK